MPAPKSILRTEKNPFLPVNNAISLYKKVVDMCIKMPKRYTYLLLQPVIELAGYIMDNAKIANSIFPSNKHEAQIRRDHWMMVRAKCQALSTRMDRFFECPGALNYHDNNTGKTKGVTLKEIINIVDLINMEIASVSAILEEDKRRFKKLEE